MKSVQRSVSVKTYHGIQTVHWVTKLNIYTNIFIYVQCNAVVSYSFLMTLVFPFSWQSLRIVDFVSMVNQNLITLTESVNFLAYTANYHNSNLNQLNNQLHGGVSQFSSVPHGNFLGITSCWPRSLPFKSLLINYSPITLPFQAQQSLLLSVIK